MTRRRKSTNQNSSTLHSDPENGVKLTQNESNTPQNELELEPVPNQIVNMKARVNTKGKQAPTMPPIDSLEDETDQFVDDDEQIADFEDLIDEYGSEELTAWVYKYDLVKQGKPSYSCRFPFQPLTVLPTIQDNHPEGGKFKIRILNENGKFRRGFTIPIEPSLSYRRPNPGQYQQQQPQQPPFNPMDMMKPMLDMQTLMMTAASTMVTSLVTQMKAMNELTAKPADTLDPIDKMVSMVTKLKEAGTNIGMTSEEKGERSTTWIDFTDNLLTTIVEKRPQIVDRVVNLIEHVVGADTAKKIEEAAKEKPYDAIGELVDDEKDDAQDNNTSAENGSPIITEEQLKAAQTEANAKFQQMIADWTANADPVPTATWLKAYVLKYKADPYVAQIPLLFMLPPEMAFEQLKDKLLGPQNYETLKALPHTLDWLKRFMQIAK